MPRRARLRPLLIAGTIALVLLASVSVQAQAQTGTVHILKLDAEDDEQPGRS